MKHLFWNDIEKLYSNLLVAEKRMKKIVTPYNILKICGCVLQNHVYYRPNPNLKVNSKFVEIVAAIIWLFLCDVSVM